MENQILTDNNSRKSPEKSPVIRVEHITKDFRIYKDKSHTFKDFVLHHGRSRYTLNRVIDDISFTVKKGQALGLIGHNGCGKSTTLKLLNKILYPDSGTIEVKGRVSSLIELGAGFHPDMSGRENIYINASIFGLKKKEIDERLDAIIQFSELEEFIDNPVRTYSSGMYMRLAFAIAINVDADVLLVDEILAVGDANFQKKCFAKLSEIKKKGTTIVIVSHSMGQIKSICDRVLWIDHGKIVEDGEANKVCNDYLYRMDQLADERKQEESGIDASRFVDRQYPAQEVAPQAGEFAHRRGKLTVRFEKITLCDETGRPSQFFSYQDTLKIRYDLAEASEEITEKEKEKVQVVFRIFHSEDGKMCSKFCSWKENLPEYSYDRIRHGVLIIPKIQIADGDYIIDACLEDGKGYQYDCLLHLIEFHVTCDPHNGMGSAAMENHWEYGSPCGNRVSSPVRAGKMKQEDIKNSKNDKYQL